MPRIKLLLAGGVCAVCAYAVMRSQGFVSSDNAVVSAYTVSLRAPIAGYVSVPGLRVGDTIKAGTMLAHVEETRVDDARLVDLRNLSERYRADIAAYELERDALARQRDDLLNRAAERNRIQAANLNLQVTEAERQMRARAAGRDYAALTVTRKDALGHTGYAPASDVDKARADAETSTDDVEAAAYRVAYLKLQADAASRGILLESGSNDVAYSSQRADEIAIRLADIDRETAQLGDALTETNARLRSEQDRIGRQRAADIVAPSTGMIWKLGATDGERLSVGDTAAELVDCDKLFILETIPQDRFSDVETGAEARVRLSGETTERIGRVVSITGDAGPDRDRNLASTPPLIRTGVAMVRIEIANPKSGTGECLVGRTARVLIAAPRGGPLRGLMDRLSF